MQVCIVYTQHLAHVCKHVMEEISTQKNKHVFAVVPYVLCETNGSPQCRMCLLFANLTWLQHANFSLWNAGVIRSQTVLLKLSPEKPSRGKLFCP